MKGVAVREVALSIHQIQARMPFRYGIASMTEAPHLFVRASVDVDGRVVDGIAADSLVPKWFTKDPETSIEDDESRALDTVRASCELALEIGRCPTPFDLWRQVYERRTAAAAANGEPFLLMSFGVSLIERAVIDAFCRATDTAFPVALRRNDLGVQLSAVHSELIGMKPADLLPITPSTSLRVRHTVGLGDPLTDDEIDPKDRVDDGLPQSLEACIEAYGLTHFKIKVRGDEAGDLKRLRRIVQVLDLCASADWVFTLDGNEQFASVENFRTFWEAFLTDTDLAPTLSRLLFVEQPFHRQLALDAEVERGLQTWKHRPSIVIDESDATVESLPRALECGYAGTSYKSCKGVFKGVANACLIEHRRRSTSKARYVLSAEDLSTVGPVSLLQDLVVVASLGFKHAERNGHHYFTGLSSFTREIQDAMLVHHGDLYRSHPNGYATLALSAGVIGLRSVSEAPFGVSANIRPSALLAPQSEVLVLG